METAYIETSVRRSPLGKIEAENHKWVGKSPYVHISLDLVRYGEISKIDGDKEIQVGPYRLLLVDKYIGDYHLYVRKDRFGALRVALYKSTRLLDLIYRRLIITLAVWGLAEYHEMTVPTWRDIKLTKWLTK